MKVFMKPIIPIVYIKVYVELIREFFASPIVS